MSRPSAHQIEIPTGLSTAADRRIDEALRLANALLALGELSRLLAENQPSRWKRAGDIAKRLRRFEAAAWKRIREGHRQPKDTLERLLARLAAADLPRSRRKIHDLLD